MWSSLVRSVNLKFKIWNNVSKCKADKNFTAIVVRCSRGNLLILMRYLYNVFIFTKKVPKIRYNRKRRRQTQTEFTSAGLKPLCLHHKNTLQYTNYVIRKSVKKWMHKRVLHLCFLAVHTCLRHVGRNNIITICLFCGIGFMKFFNAS